MSLGPVVSCVLCKRSEETTTTGALSIKDEVAAHQNCLLFSSGIYCRDSPLFDDLFGFSVEDVLKEVTRGRKLRCSKCKKKGATAGCEVKSCKRSYHYPCAVQEGAKDIEDQVKGSYGLYCFQHQQPQNTQSNGLVKGINSNSSEPGTSNNPSGAGSTKRRLSLDELEESPSKRKCKGQTFKITENSSDSDMDLFAPLESDIDESANSVPEQQFVRKDGPSQSPSGNPLENENSRRITDEDESTMDSDDSESLLFPVQICMSLSQSSELTPPAVVVKCPQVVNEEEEVEEEEGKKDEGSSPDQHTAGPSVPQQSSTGSPPSADQSKPLSPPGSPPCTSSSIPKAPPETICVSSPPHPVEPPSDPEPSIDSQSFWKGCNAAGCTQAIFTDFINEMNDIAGRIQSDQASEDDCNHALKVMAASGKLEEIVAKQQKELQRKQKELMKAAAAIKQVISALRR
ncbi:histone-lysine N-methyltransferase 2A isoform X4 [Hippoglossus hippoglossus]|uniref:histone-lysine N-methyltransferase 2A isoform X4 n=1 Tax=Hippoglossus hippoglossus TaxID=8267 RepID=UPI00148D66A7|nr:histone-lysine N-methyltransferase 2A isoform X4 [Hippoglossus hippoglossus]